MRPILGGKMHLIEGKGHDVLMAIWPRFRDGTFPPLWLYLSPYDL